MARLPTLEKGQWDQFERMLFASDLTAEEVRRLTANPSVFTNMLQLMRVHFACGELIHGVFKPSANVYSAFQFRCIEKGIDISKFAWPSANTFAFTDDPEVVVVLDVTLDTLQSTFDFAWGWTCDGQDDNWRWEHMLSDPSKLRLLDGSEAFIPYTLRWRRIKLNTDIGKKPMDVRSPQASPGVALLFVAAQHPQRVKVTDHNTRFGWHIPGLECTAISDGPSQRVPYVDLDRDARQVWLGALACGGGYDRLAVPAFRE